MTMFEDTPGIVTKDADNATIDEWCAWMRNGAALTGAATQAAVHVLNYLRLPGTVSFDKYLQVEDKTGPDGAIVRCAFVNDWKALIDLPGSRFNPSDLRMIALAVMLAGHSSGYRIRDLLEGIPEDHTRVFTEAVLIAASANHAFEITAKARVR